MDREHKKRVQTLQARSRKLCEFSRTAATLRVWYCLNSCSPHLLTARQAALCPTTDALRYVCLTPESGHQIAARASSLCAISSHWRHARRTIKGSEAELRDC